ncbi:MAG: MarR family transcriptional regulator [Clostridia bacterium]|nr:MarR family transcriptional regulator [Clostridia bacterium]
MNTERFTPFVLYIERISKNIKRIADEKMEPYGLRSAHVMCILQLGKSEGGLSSSALAEVCGVDKAFVSRITNELLEKKYITKQDGHQGKYKVKFVLTESGNQIHKIMNSIVMECLTQVDSRISMKKLEIFYEVLNDVDNGIASLVKKEK